MALLENGIGENHLIVDQEGFELITLSRGEPPARNGRYVNQIGKSQIASI